MHACICQVRVHNLAMATAGQAHPLAALGSTISSGPRSSPPPRVSLGYGSPGCIAGEAARERFPEPRGVGVTGLGICLLRGAADRGRTGASDTLGCAHSAVAATATRSGMPATWFTSQVRSSVSYVPGLAVLPLAIPRCLGLSVLGIK